MKKALLKSTFLLCALIVGSGSIWAQAKTNTNTVTTKFSANGDVTSKFTQTGNYTSTTWDLQVTWGSSASWQNLDSTKGAQIGSGSKPATGIVLTGSGVPGTISQVVVNTSGANSISATVAVKVGTTSFKCNNQNTASLTSNAANYTFTGSASGDVVLTWANSSSKAIYIKSITITYATSSKKTADLSFAVPSYKVAPNTLFTQTATNPNSLSVSYSSSDEEIAYVEPSTGQVLTGDKIGTATITASSAEDSEYEAGSATYEITTFNPNANDGSEAKPYTVTEALAIIAGYANNETSESAVYVKGIVSTGLSDIHSTNGYANYYISADGTTTAQLECFRGFNLGKTKFTATTDLTVGDEVVVYGALKKYGTTSEMNSNNYIAQYKHASEPEVKSLHVKAAEYRTYVASANLIVPAGVKAYIATGESSTTLTLKSVAKIKKDSPVILNASEGYYTFEITDEAVDYGTDTNLLKISDGTAINGVFVLAKHGSDVGFYKWAGGALSPGKVYVEAPATTARDFLGFAFEDEDVTGINEVKGEKKAVEGIFDLQGRKVVTPAKGLYIVNGKKVIIK